MQGLQLIEEQEEIPINEFEVEAVKGIREVDSKTEYYIKWKGYPHTENSWEPEENLNCADLIEDYLRKIRVRALRRRLLEGVIL